MSKANSKATQVTSDDPPQVESPESRLMSITGGKNVFMADQECAAITGRGVARIYAALNAIESISAILMQREMDLESELGFAIDHPVAIGLIEAIGVCAEFANDIANGGSVHGAVFGVDSEPSKQIDEMVRSRRTFAHC